MMNFMDELLTELSSRLPELEWKIGSLTSSISSRNLPKGLFRLNQDISAQAFIDEIKIDIKALARQKNQRSANYIASRIHQKINVLVTLYQLQSKHSKPEAKMNFGLTMLTTRQQWIKTLEEEIQTLESQKLAMVNALKQFERGENSVAILDLQAELGEIERRLSLAKETLEQAQMG